MKSRMREDWLQLVREAPLDPAQPIIDPHHHLWLTNPRRDFPYTIDHLARDVAAGHRVVATVFVQCMTQYRQSGPEHLKPVGETEWVHACAEEHARRHPEGPALCAGIVGEVDFRHDPAQVDEALQAHHSASPRFRGIRQMSAWTDDQVIVPGRTLAQRHLLVDPAFRKGFAQLARRGLSFDAWMYHDQLPEMVSLARAFPDTPMVVDHLGAPLGQGGWADRREEMLREWRRSIAELAACPNVHMKLGGTLMPMFGFDWERRPLPPTSDELAEAAGHFFHAAIEAFTPARCMFESNFPVDRVGSGYVPLWNSFKKMAARYSPSECADLFWGTAKRFYRLDGVTVPA